MYHDYCNLHTYIYTFFFFLFVNVLISRVCSTTSRFIFAVVPRTRRIGHGHGADGVSVRGLRADAAVTKTRLQKQFLPATCGEQRVSQASTDGAAPPSDTLP